MDRIRNPANFPVKKLGTSGEPSPWDCRAPWAGQRSWEAVGGGGVAGLGPWSQRTPAGWWAGLPPPLLLLRHPLRSYPTQPLALL